MRSPYAKGTEVGAYPTTDHLSPSPGLLTPAQPCRALPRRLTFAKLPSLPLTLTPSLRPLERLIRPYERRTLLQAGAGLQLSPRNSHVQELLESLCTACAPNLDGGGQVASEEDLRSLFRQPVLNRGLLVTGDDPHEHLFTEAFPFHGGNFLVFPGATTGGTQPLKVLVEALSWEAEAYDEAFHLEAMTLVAATLKLSQALCMRAGLSAHQEPLGHHWNDPQRVQSLVHVPSHDELYQLTQAVTLQADDLDALLSRAEQTALARHLLIAAGDVRPHPHSLNDGALRRRPLLDGGEEWFVAAPHSLLAATTRAVLHLAQDARQTEVLTAHQVAVQATRTERALLRLGCQPLDCSLDALGQPQATQAIYALDADKVLHVLTITQDAAWVDTGRMIGQWRVPLPAAPPTLPKELRGMEVLHLLVIADQGDAYQAELSPAWRDRHLLAMRPDDLVTFAAAHPGDTTALWKVQRSREALRRVAGVRVDNPLDELAFHSRRHFPLSFPFPKRSLIVLGGREGPDWRREITRKRNEHLVPWIDGQTLVPVERAEFAPPAVHLPPIAIWTRGHAAVSQDGATIWVVDASGHDVRNTPVEQGSSNPPAGWAMDEFVQGTAVWLSELLPWLPRSGAPVTTVALHAPREGQSFALALDLRRHRLHLRLGAEWTDLLAEPHNVAERYLVALLHQGLSRLATGRPASLRRTRRVVHRVAPRGDKRLFMRVETYLNTELDPRGLVPVRHLSPAEEHEWALFVGRTLAAKHRWKPGREVALTTDLLIEVNGLLFKELQEKLKVFQGQPLLELLLAHYEAVRHEAAQLTHSQLSRELLFGPYARVPHPRAEETATGLRFLLELLAAELPTGSRSPSLTALDDLLALGVAIIRYGVACDALRYHLGEVRGRLTEEGALVVEAPEYVGAQLELRRMAQRQAAEEANARRYEMRDVPVKQDDDDPRPQWIETLCVSLYRISLRRLVVFINAALNIGDHHEGGVVFLPLGEFRRAMVEELPWPEEELDLALAALALTPREDFFAVPPGLTRSEVYPWHFNRELSLTRRPFILTSLNGESAIAWGNRALESSKKHWIFTRMIEGRMQLPASQTPEHRRAAEALRQLTTWRSAAFNRAVAEEMRSLGYSVMENVSRFGRLKMQEDGETLGDVDVLVIDETRQRLVLIECKAYAPARTPAELAGQMEELVKGRRRAGKPRARSLMERHVRRAAFIGRHLTEVLAFLKVPAVGEWQVEPIYAMSFFPNIMLADRAPFPLLHLEQLADWFGSNGPGPQG